jgi:hypothetical protein
MKTYGGVEVYLRAFLSSALDGVVSFTPGKRDPETRGGLDAVENIKISYSCRESNPDY